MHDVAMSYAISAPLISHVASRSVASRIDNATESATYGITLLLLRHMSGNVVHIW